MSEMIKNLAAPIFSKGLSDNLGKLLKLIFYSNPARGNHSIYNSRRPPNRNSPILSHIAFFLRTGNAGDVVLPATLQDLFITEHRRSYRWSNHKIQKNCFNERAINKINSTAALIIGGGGLFLMDTNANQNSGWQWNCSLENLNKITVPICLFAVGYNRFRGQDDFSPVFRQHVNLLAEKSFMLGLRNHGSIESLKKYLDPQHHNKLVYQPCMTTLASKIYGDMFVHRQDSNIIAINCAFDRPHLRFGDNMHCILSQIALACKHLSRSFRIAVYSHIPRDDSIIPYLQSHRVPFEWVALYKLNKEEIFKQYAKPSLVIGMRGHAQLIPFGLHIPTISLVSHDKLKWFLEDINHTEWALEVADENLSQKLIGMSEDMLCNRNKIVLEIVESQDVLYKLTQKNLELAKNYIAL